MEVRAPEAVAVEAPEELVAVASPVVFRALVSAHRELWVEPK